MINPEDFITDDKTNKVFISSLLPNPLSGFPEDSRKKLYDTLKEYLQRKGIAYEELLNTRDVWCRDYMPVQITKDSYLSYTYHPDYLVGLEGTITNWILHKVHTKKTAQFDFPDNKTLPILLDGGNVVKAINKDGKPTIILCDKVLNENHISENDFKDWWKDFFDNDIEIVLLKWDGPKYNPIGHADGMVRYVSPGVVLMTNYCEFDKELAESHRQTLEKHFTVHQLKYESTFSNEDKNEIKLWRMLKEHSWSYINFLQVGHNILLPRLGYDKLDNSALKQIQDYYGKEFSVELIDCDMMEIIAGDGNGSNSGGALNCLTWNVFNNYTSKSNVEKISELLSTIPENGILKEITDPVEWQRQQRGEWKIDLERF